MTLITECALQSLQGLVFLDQDLVPGQVLCLDLDVFLDQVQVMGPVAILQVS